MKRKVIAMLICIAAVLCFAVGCTPSATTAPANENTPTPTAKVDSTATPTPAATEKPAATPTPEATATPEPTPGEELPDQSDLYTWEYKEFDPVKNPGEIEVVIVVKEGVDPLEIKKVVVPEKIDGYTVTKIPYDFFGCRYPQFGGRRGFMYATKWDDNGNVTEWNDSWDCAVQEVVFPATIKILENNIFWAGAGSLQTITFLGTDNITTISRQALGNCPAEVTWAKANDGFIVINGMLEVALPAKDITFPSNVKEVTNGVFHALNQNYAKVKNIVINDGCEIIRNAFGENLTLLKSVTVPASVKEIEGDLLWGKGDTVEYKCYENSYAHQYAVSMGYKNITLITD